MFKMSSLKRTKSNTTEKKTEQKMSSYVEEVNGTVVEETYEAAHPMLQAMKTHLEATVEKEDHLKRYTEVDPFK
jgi:hypothetical protein|tara:strand:+ start:1350 stop:1571 length:222 start_codon:yes stop_codon:yes gene_type:complete